MVPVYRGESCLDELHRRVTSSVSPITPDFELVLVDDGSPDAGWDRILRLAEADPRVRGLKLSRNFGQHQAITAGLDACDGDWVVVMDGDLQDRPEDIPALYERATQGGFEMVVARRVARGDPQFKRAANRLYYAVFRALTGIPYDPAVGNFRIMSRLVVDNFRGMRERLRFFGVLADSLGFPTGSVAVEHGARFAGPSSYRLGALVRLAAHGIVAYSNRPLIVSIASGFGLAALALAGAGYLAWLRLVSRVTVTGWASTIVSLYFLAGVLLVNLGIVGLYLASVFDQVKGRPLYVVHRTVGPSPPRP